jgi:probable addiction module antidote protein
VTRFAQEAGLSREAVYKAFTPGGNPTLETLTKALAALGLRLAVVPADGRDAA